MTNDKLPDQLKGLFEIAEPFEGGAVQVFPGFGRIDLGHMTPDSMDLLISQGFLWLRRKPIKVEKEK
jgi:hypothetical protein